MNLVVKGEVRHHSNITNAFSVVGGFMKKPVRTLKTHFLIVHCLTICMLFVSVSV